MSSTGNSFPFRKLALAAALSLPVVAAAGTTGNIGVFSQYVLRGMTNAPEDSSTALQGGLDYAADSGWYLGYWGSSLGYSSEADGGDGFENDLYGGYAGSAGDVSYSLGLLQYYYVNVDNSDLTEFSGSIGYGPVSFGVKYLLNDGAWGNSGDAYWTLGYATDLPSNFKFAATLGYYTYSDDDNSDLASATVIDSGFRHLDLTVSHPIGNTGADMLLTYTVGGKDRTDTDQEDAVVFGVKYGFDL